MYLLMNTVGHVVVPMFLTSTPQQLCNFEIFILFVEVFFMTVKSKLNKTNKLKFSDKLSPHAEKLFHLSKFLRHAVWGR